MKTFYLKIENLKVIDIEEQALQKLEANKERPLSEASIEARAVLQVINYLRESASLIIEGPACPQVVDNTVEAQRAQIRELRKGYIDMALIIEQLTTKDLTEEDIKDMRERADRLKESIK